MAKMITKTNQRVVVENVSEHNLGVERPLSLFLRTPNKNRSAHLSRAEINASDITTTMRVWRDKGWLTITPAIEYNKKLEADRAKKTGKAKLKKKETPKRTSPDDQTLARKIDTKGDFDPKPPAVGSEVKGGEPKSDVGPPQKEEAKEPKPKGAHIVAPEDKEGVPTVGSSADGSPEVSEPVTEPEPETSLEAEEEEAPASVDKVFEEAQLQDMKLKALRVIIQDLGLDVKSAQKGVLIKAILGAQGGSPEVTEDPVDDQPDSDQAETGKAPSPTED